MLKALMKKQLLEMSAFLFQNKKDGKRRKAGSILLYVILFIYCFGIFGSLFYQFADAVCEVYFDIGFGWLYFTLFGIIATAMGIFLSIFSVYSTIYQAKDNEFLLSVPVKPPQIILAKLIGCYITTFIFEALVMVPSYIVFFMNMEWGPLDAVLAVLTLLLLPFLALTVACILGLLIAFIASKLPKNARTAATLLISVAFLGVYFYAASDSQKLIQVFINNPDSVADAANIMYPLYMFGKGMEGEISSYLIFAGISILLFAVVHFVLSKTFIKIATANKGSIVKKFEKKSLSSASAGKALLKREFIHLKSSATYMLNCCMGTLLTIMAAVFVIISSDMINETINTLGITADITGLIVCGAIALISGMNDLTAPSISLEGKSIWIVQSLPVSPWKVLKSKIMLHMIPTVIPALVLAAVLQFIFDMTPITRIMTFVCAVVFPLFEAAFGLILNLKMPNLNWTDEMIAVKQGANVMIAIFGGWVIVIALGILYYAVSGFLSASLYLILAVALVLVVTAVMLLWIRKKGAEIFSKL